MSDKNTLVIGDPSELGKVATRRSFLKMLGVGGSIVLLPSVFAACGDDDDDNGTGTGAEAVFDLRTDIGILNYAYALEQLEAAFYTAVVAGFGTNGITNATEQAILTDIRNHEVIHRDFLAAALGSAKIRDLEVDFGNAPNARTSALETARTFEDLGVTAYNGAGKYLKDARNLLVAGKIVSVEARHAAVIRDILQPNSNAFAPDALDGAVEPNVGLAGANPFVETGLRISNPPTLS
jgi:hypothetical protein